MSFRNKILLSIWGVVLSLLVITFFIINYWTRSRIEETFSRELRSNYTTALVQEKLQSAQLVRACIVIAESPRLRAVTEIGDVKTASQLLQELNRTTLSQIFVLTDRSGRCLVQLLRRRSDHWSIPDSTTIERAIGGVASTDFWSIGGKAYRVVSVPIAVESDLVGTLTIGFEVTRVDIASLREATSSEIVLASDRSPVLSTIDSAEARLVLSSFQSPGARGPGESADTAGHSFKIVTQNDTYLASAVPLHHPAGADASEIYYLIIKPLNRELQQFLRPILSTFGIVSLAFLGLTTIIGLVISRGMTRPILELMKGTTEITRGNYDYNIHVASHDELSVLAGRFMEMSSSLKGTISQLGKANADLVERNRDLDDTLRKLQSAQEDLLRAERLAATGKLTAQLSHEINNPIHNIQSLLESSLRKTDEQNPAHELIRVALEEVSRLGKLTRQMLEFYKGSVVEVEQDIVDMRDLIGEVVRTFEEPLSRLRIRINLTGEERLPPVRGSRDKLKQVLVNLLLNARDAMPHGGIITLSAHKVRSMVRIEVTDTGVGIPAENLGRIFDAFFTTKQEVSGVGLGLAVSYGIIQQHKGTIYVASTVGEGTTFTVQLPVASDIGAEALRAETRPHP